MGGGHFIFFLLPLSWREMSESSLLSATACPSISVMNAQ